MKKLRINHNEKGFTLIELMIVIAIIGILAAIAIPNFIAYRNKTFCSRAESDGNAVAAAIADYFALPNHVDTPADTDLFVRMSGTTGTDLNTFSVSGANPSEHITITVSDQSSRCPNASYRAQYTSDNSAWDTADPGVYTKYIDVGTAGGY